MGDAPGIDAEAPASAKRNSVHESPGHVTARVPCLGSSRFATPILGRSLQQFCGVDIEYGREFTKHINACAIDATLQSADVRSIDFGIMS